MPLFKMQEKGLCAWSVIQANGTTYAFCYDMVTILHVEYVGIYVFFQLFLSTSSKVYDPLMQLNA